MTQSYVGMKIFSCCRKEGICLKLWILIFVCSLLCVTCLLIESRRDNSNKKHNRDAQKLIQIRTKAHNAEINNDLVEESSGYYMDTINLNSDLHPEQVNDDEGFNRHERHQMPAASNCINKNNENFNIVPQKIDVTVVGDYDYKDLVDDMEKMLEFPVFSNAKAEENSMEFNNLERIQISDDIDDIDVEQNGDSLETHAEDEEEKIFLPVLTPTNEKIIELTSSVKETPNNDWDFEDRFFPDEHAFRMEPSMELLSTEIGEEPESEHENEQQLFHNEFLQAGMQALPIHALPIQAVPIQAVPVHNVDIPKMLDSFFGKISTFLTPGMAPDANGNHLANFQDNQYGEDHMRLASSKMNPVWRTNPTAARSVFGHFTPTIHPHPLAHLKPNFLVNKNTPTIHPHPFAHLKPNFLVNKNSNVNLFPKLLSLNGKK